MKMSNNPAKYEVPRDYLGNLLEVPFQQYSRSILDISAGSWAKVMVAANLMQGVALRWTRILSRGRGRSDIHLVAACLMKTEITEVTGPAGL